MQLRPYQVEAVQAGIDFFSGKPDAGIIIAPTGAGKAQPVSEPILTPDGRKKMSDILVGDFVIGQNGKPVKVIQIHPQGIKQTYKVIFSDGSSTRCCNEHLWSVRTKYDKADGIGYRNVNIGYLKNNLHGAASNYNKWFIPLVEPIEYSEKQFDIHPYLLGVLLGDGSFRHHISITSPELSIIKKCNLYMPEGESFIMSKHHKYGYMLNSNSKHSKFKKNIIKLGLLDKMSYEKHIPEEYLFGSIEQRLDLLRGLMDTDGYKSKNGAEITTSSKDLANGIYNLVMGLGGLTQIKLRENIWFTYKGEKRDGRNAYRINVNTIFNPFYLESKAKNYSTVKTQGRTRAIVDIIEDGYEECKCITVNSSDGLYITKDYIVTHNSLYIASIVDSINEKVIILQPSKELLEQNYEKFTMLGGKAKIFSASFGVKEIGKVTYATIGSINKQCAKLKKMGFTKLIIDECDRYSKAGTGQLNTFIKQVGFTHTLGLTATPFKLQTNSMNGSSYSKIVMLTNRGKETNFFKRIIHVLQIQDIIKMGFWSKLEYEQYDTDVSGLVYNSTKSDFTEESIKRVYHTNDIHGKIIQKIKDLYDRKSILVFCPSVEESIMLSDMTPNSAVVYGDMDKSERKYILDRFKSGEIRVIYNYAVLSVGFDHPGLDCIILGRSTGSLSSYYQWLGRGVRLHKDKDYCLIVDFGENIKRFGKVEHLSYQLEGKNWKLYGEDNKLLSGIPIHTIGDLHKGEQEDIEMSFGKYKGQMMSTIGDDYLQRMLDNIKWNSYNRAIKLWITNKLTHGFTTCILSKNNYNGSIKNKYSGNTIEFLYKDGELLGYQNIGKTKSNLPFMMIDKDSWLKICNL